MHVFAAPFKGAAPNASVLFGVELRGRDNVKRWQAHARAGEWAAVFDALMREHYDPLYLKSIGRNYAGVANATPISLSDGAAPTLHEAARSLLGGAALSKAAAG